MRYLALLLLSCCSCMFAPDDATPFTPSVPQRQAWADAQACTGRTGRFEDLHFFTVPGEYFASPAGGRTVGWFSGKDIYIAEPYINNHFALKHEMVHVITGISGHPDHPFVDPCRVTWETYVP